MRKHNGGKIGAFNLFRFEPCNKDDIPVSRALGRNRGECRPDNAAASVSLDCAAELFCGCYADSAAETSVLDSIGHQGGGRFDLSPAVSTVKLGILF